MNIGAILEKMLEQTGWDQTKLAKQLRTTQPTISRWIGGSEPRSKNEKRIKELAARLQVIPNHGDENTDGVCIIGYIGAGGEILYSEGQGPFGEAPMPPDGRKPDMVAVEVRGDSMGVLGDKTIIYYDNRQERPTEALFGKLCVVGLPDGRILLKTLLPSAKPGLFNLISLTGSPIFDQRLDWVAQVSFIGFP